MLDISPVLSIRNGLIEAIGKVRGRKKLAKKLFKYLIEHAPNQTGSDFIIANGNMDEEAEELIAYLKEAFPDCSITLAGIGPTIATHIGPVLGLFYKK